MGIYDISAAGVQQNAQRLFDVSGAGVQSEIGNVFDVSRAGVLSRVYESKLYLIKDGTPQMPWSRAEVQSHGDVSSYIEAGYGALEIKSGAASTLYVNVISFATEAPLNLAGFSTITFVIDKWGRDASANGYFHTSAGLYSSRTVGRGGMYTENVKLNRPDSEITGWTCNEINAGVHTLELNGLGYAYVGFASGGSRTKFGEIVVRDIYLS